MSLEAGRHLREDALDEFTRRTGIHVDVIPTPGTSTDQLKLIRETLDRQAPAPDIYLIDIIWPGTLHQHFLDLSPYIDNQSRGHLPELLKSGAVKDRLVSLPLYVNVGMLFYRADLLEKYGYRQPPNTWEQLESMAARIQSGERRNGKRDFWGYVWQGGAYEGLTCNALEWQASFGGGHIIERDGSITVNNPRTVRALRRASRWIGFISPKSVLSYTESDTLNVFRSGHAAFMRFWGSGYRPARAFAGVPGASLRLAPLPSGPRRRAQATGGFQLAVSRYSAHPREAAQLVLFLTGAEVQTRRAFRRGYLPTREQLYTVPELTQVLPQLEVLANTGRDAWVSRPSTVAGAEYAEVSRAYYQTVHQVLSGHSRPEPALGNLEQRLTQLTGLGRDALRH
jgi:trehalose/maltose transport system substrate-binding protein